MFAVGLVLRGIPALTVGLYRGCGLWSNGKYRGILSAII